MKHLSYKIFTILVLWLVTISCDNFLTEKPRGIVSPNSYFKSDKEAKSAVNGLYRTYQAESLYGVSDGIYQYYEYGADTEGPNRKYGGIEPLQSYTINSSNINEGNTGGARHTWQLLYRVIQDANLIISKVSDNESMSESGRNQNLGETLFLRSLAYYNLTNIWGNVPYYRESLPVAEVQKLGRTDKTEIQKDLINDLKQAANLLPESYSENDKGRATKWAAKTLLVKIDLWLKKWKEARETAVDIIKSPHRLLENYTDVFKPSNEYNDEIIFQFVYAKDLLTERFTSFFNPRIRDEPKYDADRQGLKDSLSAHDQGFTGYGLAVPLPDLVSEWPANDLRKQASIITKLYGYELKFPYFQKLWNLDKINAPRGNQGDNFVLFRLADVYLMAAEAENELNGPANAYQYINKVRKRAFDPDQPLAGLTQEQFRKAVQEERKWELAGEGYRRMDLIRWGILLETIKNTQYRVYDPASNIQSHNVLLPIPDKELELNPNLLKSDPTNNGYK